MKERKLGISNPGNHVISPSEAVKRNPSFFTDRPQGVNWILRIKHLDGTVEEIEPGTDWEVISRFGTIRLAVVTNQDGSPVFDRPRYDESPNVNIVAWGKDRKGRIRVALISQERPHADDVFRPEQEDEPMVFDQIPMGFLDKVIGEDQVKRFEQVAEGAARETSEETGASIIKDISYPLFPAQYPNPAMIGTSSALAFVEVDLDRIEELKTERGESIYYAEYVPLDQLLKEIKQGKTERGYARMCTSNSAILIFLSGLSEYQKAGRNARIADDFSRQIRKARKADPEKYRKLKEKLIELANQAE